MVINSEQEMKEYLEKIKGMPIIPEDLIDMHMHSTTSDGTLTSHQLIDFCIQRGLKTISITEHDTVESIQSNLEYAEGKPIEIIPGIEFSCEEMDMGFAEVHVLGYFIDHTNAALIEATTKMKHERLERGKLIIQKVQDLGYNITFDEVAARVGVSFARPHIAKVLMEKYPDRFQRVQDVFDELIGNGKPAHIPRKDKISVKQAIKLITNAGGITSLAHPCVFKNFEHVEELIDHFVSVGGKAIETEYAYGTNIKGLTPEEGVVRSEFVKKIVQEKGLLNTGGSDFHGLIRPIYVGDAGLTREMFEKLQEHR
jgi:3',5'-nucleoside bisphosphate phosphatase